MLYTAEKEVVDSFCSKGQQPGIIVAGVPVIEKIINQHRHRSLTIDTIAAALTGLIALGLAVIAAMID